MPLARWLDQAASTRLRVDLKTYVEAVQGQADRTDTKAVLVACTPPAKSSLPRQQLSSEWLRKNRLGLTTTYAWSAAMHAGAPVLRRHALADAPPDVSRRPFLEDLDAGEDEWREAYRLQEPELAMPGIGSLQHAWDRNKSLLQDLPARREPWSVRCAAFAKRKALAKAQSPPRCCADSLSSFCLG